MASGTFDPYLEAALTARGAALETYSRSLVEFSQWVHTDVNSQAAYTDRYAPPILEPYDAQGKLINRIVLNPWYERQHEEVYRRGIIGLPYSEAAPHLLSFTMGYLLAQADISLHCPVTLTGAVAYVLRHHASIEARQRYLHELIRMDGLAKTGGTWATELHGGSDVGATTTIAEPADGYLRLRGLKWFTSNANSGLALATARPVGASSGSEGLALYLVPSHLDDGTPNSYRIRRLKEKLGTTGLPTGEIDLEGAFAVEIAPPPFGMKVMMEALEYSRIHNAVGAAGVQRRALREATAWARSRSAFGQKLIEFPMVRDQLVALRVRFEASALIAFEAALAFDGALADETMRTWLRITTALSKYLTAEDSINATRAALELLGGNGYTRDFPAERLLRDAQVLTVWEGPANIQALELLRMLSGKHRGTLQYENRVRSILEQLPDECSDLCSPLAARLAEDLRAIEFVTASDKSRATYARKLLHRLSQSLAFALMCEFAKNTSGTLRSRNVLAALRYFDEIDPPSIGQEHSSADCAIELLEDEPPGIPEAASQPFTVST